MRGDVGHAQRLGEARRTPPARAPRRERRRRARARVERRVDRSRLATPASSSEFASVLRRCANARLDDALQRRYSAPQSRVRRKATSAESTFGGGRKTFARPGGSRSARPSAARAPRPRRSPSSRPAKKRSATSRCTITHQRSSDGRPSRLSTTSGVATCRAGSRRASPAADRARRAEAPSASPKTSSTLARPPSASRRVRLERPVELDGVDVRDAVGEVGRQDAEPGADLQHDVLRLELGEPPDHAEDVRVGEEVLAELAFRRDAHGSPNAAAAFASIRASSSRRLLPAGLRERRERVDHVGRLVRPPAHRLRREVRACRSRRGCRSAGTRAAAQRSSAAFG